MKTTEARLSRREREIMDIIYRAGRASAADVREAMEDPPSYSAVRTMLKRLEEKGQVAHERRGAQYIYSAVMSRHRARDSALRRLVATFFDSSPTKLMSAVLDRSAANLSREELDEIEAMIAHARTKAKK